MKTVYINFKLFGRYTGIMIFPFLIVSKKAKSVRRTENHERIHYHQCLELWVIGFYVLYGWYHLKYGYKNNPFEMEARLNARNFMYLNIRDKFNWRRYES